MEMLVIATVVLVAFAAVLVPLFRRRPGVGDEREFENIPPADTAVSPTAPGGAADPTAHDAPYVPRAGAAEANTQAGAVPADPLEGEVMRYREAVRAGTVCRKCGQASPADSNYCFECGASLPRADAKEFE